LGRLDIVAPHGDGGNAIPPLDEWIFRLDFNASDLAQRDRFSIPRYEGEVFQLGGIQSLGPSTSRDNIDCANVLTNLGDGLTV
jgi:hypothetical protein